MYRTTEKFCIDFPLISFALNMEKAPGRNGHLFSFPNGYRQKADSYMNARH